MKKPKLSPKDFNELMRKKIIIKKLATVPTWIGVIIIGALAIIVYTNFLGLEMEEGLSIIKSNEPQEIINFVKRMEV